MKHFTLILGMFYAISAFGQTTSTCDGGRFYDELYQVDVTTNVEYGQNTNFSGQNQKLRFNFYEPQGDTLEKRPLIIWAFGGSFLFGDKLSPDIVRLSNEFASRGYTCAAIDYRLFFYPINQEQTLKAVVRAVHDMKAAVRFFRKDALTANVYNIDPDRIFVGGVSAGGITAVQVGYLNLTEEIPAAIVADSAAFGGIEGVSGNPGYPSNPNLIINLCGAVGDTNWMIPSDVPIVSLHGTSDGTVPYGSQEIEVTGTPIGFFVDGSGSLHVRADNIGIDNLLYTWQGVGHTPFINTSNGAINEAYMDTVVWTTRDFMLPYACREITTVGVKEASNALEFLVYPNPASGQVRINFASGAPIGVQLTITDMSGKQVMLAPVQQGQMSAVIEIENLLPGIYFVRAQHGSQIVNRKLVVY
jgi:poly(3-hydroxybutyrate) depolymerase